MFNKNVFLSAQGNPHVQHSRVGEEQQTEKAEGMLDLLCVCYGDSNVA